jgi:U3 small nucleolar RNA-associated protein 14
MKKLFVTEEENAVYDQFEKEKEAEIEGELGDSIPTAEIKKGWNEWAGQGARINEKKHTDRVKKASDVRKGKIEEMRKKRADFKMRGVILNTEERDKKFAQKYLLKELPHPYNNIE